MTAPRFVPCQCGHPRTAHPASEEEACTVPRCFCQEYIPNTLTRPEHTPILAAAAPTAKELAMTTSPSIIDQAKATGDGRITRLADKAEQLLDELAVAVQTYAAQESARQEIVALEAKLNAARARLGGTAVSPRKGRKITTRQACPDCGKDFANLGVHRYHAHPA